MGKKDAPPKQTEEEKQAAKQAKVNDALIKAAKNDELKKLEDALSKGAEVDHLNEHGHTTAHVAAAFGALRTLQWLNAKGADLTKLNSRNRTPLQTAAPPAAPPLAPAPPPICRRDSARQRRHLPQPRLPVRAPAEACHTPPLLYRHSLAHWQHGGGFPAVRLRIGVLRVSAGCARLVG